VVAAGPLLGPLMLQHLSKCGLSKYDMPEYFLALDALPLTASGKILKRALVEQVSAGLLQPTPVRWEESS
jgi:acyl-CoA synthetase